MSDDIRSMMDEWPYDPEDEIMVRRVMAPDGQPRLQIRLELGILELHLDGRPDGMQPNGFASLLEYYQDKDRRERADSVDEGFKLSHEDCQDLQREAMQFYHRRISWLRLGEFGRAAADAEHNLAIMDLLRDHHEDREDWLESEQFRAFVLSHLARARALHHLNGGDRDQALRALDDGIETIETLFREEYEHPELVSDSDELRGLVELRRSLQERPYAPVGIRRESDRERLQRELTGAVEREDYERAAELRDALAKLRAARTV